jgi:hypothetical protein
MSESARSNQPALVLSIVGAVGLLLGIGCCGAGAYLFSYRLAEWRELTAREPDMPPVPAEYRDR